MNDKKIAPYGSWKSPITSEMIATSAIRLEALGYDGNDTYWIEMRPAEKGRYVVVRQTRDGEKTDVTPVPFNARTRAHEYGGGAVVIDGGTIWFSNFSDQRIYHHKVGQAPQPLTPEGDMYYADGIIDRRRGRMICVREDHSAADREAVNTIVAVDLEKGGAGDILVSGRDFYSNPRLSPDGSQLAWLSWNHPNMPWDGTELWVGDVQDDGSLGESRRVAGGEDESIFQPRWSPDGVLYFVSDRSNWGNLYRLRDGEVEPVVEMEAEFGLPQWVFGMSTYAFESPGQIACVYAQRGIWNLALIDTKRCELRRIDTPYTDIDDVEAAPGRILFSAASPIEPRAVVELDLIAGECNVLRRSTDASVDFGYLSIPDAIEFPTDGGLTAHAFYYPPTNRDFEAPEGERPPLVVISHGGPTSAARSGLKWGIQYWTSRGFAVLDVNYGGSTGYGREYRNRLRGQWGIVDMTDCANAARCLVEQRLADGERLAIRGGSAGGYTTLCALTFRDDFKAGASHYGVSDLEALAKETHKFESRYLDRLVGPYPDALEVYKERSPVYHTDRLSCPLIFFQGLDDKIVLPNQAEMMVDALRKRGLPVAYVPFEGEQHGFRQSANIQRALDAELYFYSKIFGFKLAEPVEPVEIENLE